MSLGVATWPGKLKKSQRGTFCISGLSFGSTLTDRLDPWLWANTVVQKGPGTAFWGAGTTVVLSSGCWVSAAAEEGTL